MNQLTIEQLKSLEVGDWVWVVYPNMNDYCSEYILKSNNSTEERLYSRVDTLEDGRETFLLYSDYGTKWVAYKNKEQAEAKGDLYKTAFELILQDVYDNRLKADTLSCSSCPFMFELFDRCENQGLYEDCKKRWQDYYLTEAERRLAELTKE